MALKREGLLKIVNEMMDILNKKEITPMDALNVTSMLGRDVKDSIELNREDFLKNGIFIGHAKQD